MKISKLNHMPKSSLALGLGLSLIAAALPRASRADGFRQTNLVSDIPGLAAVTDPDLINAWGLQPVAKHLHVVVATENSLAKFYRNDGQQSGDSIEVDEDPTGVVWNAGPGFRIGQSHGRQSSWLIFVTEAGKILGWNPHVDRSAAIVAVDNSGSEAVYKGVALARGRGGVRLYATNFRGGVVEMYDSNWKLLGTFTDPEVDEGFAPFNVVNVGGMLVVTFAKQEEPEAEDDEPGPGNGFVDIFTPDGHLQRRLVAHGPLNSPWGVAMAPPHFGQFSHALLVGNFGDGRINAFNPRTGDFLGSLSDTDGNPITIGGLWALKFDDDRSHGHGAHGGPVLYFTAGLGDETHGLYGKLVPDDGH